MGTITATMLIGGTHPYHGGITPTHMILFRENDCPILTLIQLRRGPIPSTFGIVVEKVDNVEYKVSWVPRSWNDVLEDALLMVGIYILRIPELEYLARKIFGNMAHVSIPDLKVGKDEIRKMRKILKKHIGEHDIKIVLTVMLNSILLRQIPILREYEVAFEVCVSRFQRLRGYWHREGELGGFIEEDYARLISGWTKKTTNKK